MYRLYRNRSKVIIITTGRNIKRNALITTELEEYRADLFEDVLSGETIKRQNKVEGVGGTCPEGGSNNYQPVEPYAIC